MGGGRPQDNGPAVTAARAALASFETQMGNLDALLGPELGSWASYEANAVQLLVRRGTPDDGYRIARQPIARQPIAWPLSTPLADFGSVLGDLRCGVVSGSDLDLLMPLLKTANTLTPWTDGGASFGIWFRQELPGDPRFAFCPLVSR
jgi:hypothetical protein